MLREQVQKVSIIAPKMEVFTTEMLKVGLILLHHHLKEFEFPSLRHNNTEITRVITGAVQVVLYLHIDHSIH
jgi:hypothetical protein